MIEIAAKLQEQQRRTRGEGAQNYGSALYVCRSTAWQRLSTKALTNIADKQTKNKENTANKQPKARGAHTPEGAKKQAIKIIAPIKKLLNE